MWSSVAALEACAIVSVCVKSPRGLPSIMFMSSEEISKLTSNSSSTRSTPLWTLSKLDIVIDHEFVSYLTTQFTIRIRQSYKILSLIRAVFCYQPDTQRDERVNQMDAGWSYMWEIYHLDWRNAVRSLTLEGVSALENNHATLWSSTQYSILCPILGANPQNKKTHNQLIFNKLKEKASPAFAHD